jgi:hypothetical protein
MKKVLEKKKIAKPTYSLSPIPIQLNSKGGQDLFFPLRINLIAGLSIIEI